MKNHARSFFLSEESFGLNVCDRETRQGSQTVKLTLFIGFITRSQQEILCYLPWYMRHNVNWKTLGTEIFADALYQIKFVSCSLSCHKHPVALLRKQDLMPKWQKIPFKKHGGLFIRRMLDQHSLPRGLRCHLHVSTACFSLATTREKHFLCHHKNSPEKRKKGQNLFRI